MALRVFVGVLGVALAGLAAGVALGISVSEEEVTTQPSEEATEINATLHCVHVNQMEMIKEADVNEIQEDEELLEAQKLIVDAATDPDISEEELIRRLHVLEFLLWAKGELDGWDTEMS